MYVQIALSGGSSATRLSDGGSSPVLSRPSRWWGRRVGSSAAEKRSPTYPLTSSSARHQNAAGGAWGAGPGPLWPRPPTRTAARREHDSRLVSLRREPAGGNWGPGSIGVGDQPPGDVWTLRGEGGARGEKTSERGEGEGTGGQVEGKGGARLCIIFAEGLWISLRIRVSMRVRGNRVKYRWVEGRGVMPGRFSDRQRLLPNQELIPWVASEESLKMELLEAFLTPRPATFRETAAGRTVEISRCATRMVSRPLPLVPPSLLSCPLPPPSPYHPCFPLARFLHRFCSSSYLPLPVPGMTLPFLSQTSGQLHGRRGAFGWSRCQRWQRSTCLFLLSVPGIEQTLRPTMRLRWRWRQAAIANGRISKVGQRGREGQRGRGSLLVANSGSSGGDGREGCPSSFSCL